MTTRVAVDPKPFRLTISRNGVSLPATLVDLSRAGFGALVDSFALTRGLEVLLSLHSETFQVSGVATCMNARHDGELVRAGFKVISTVGDDLAGMVRVLGLHSLDSMWPFVGEI